MSLYYDRHTINVHTRGASEEQLRSVLTNALSQLRHTTGQPIPCTIDINLVKDKEGNSQGYAYVYLSNPAFYYALDERNLDGTPRVEVEELCEEVGEYDSSKSWADMEPVCIHRKLEPLVELGPYNLTVEQMVSNTEAGYPDETEGYFKYSPAYVKDTPGLESNVLIGFCTPPGVIADELGPYFARFSTTGSTWPKIVVGPKVITVRYQEGTHDALFALNMLRKLVIYDKQGNVKHRLTFKQSSSGRRGGQT